MELETPEEKEEKKPKCRTQSILKKTSILVKENKKKTSVFFQESNTNELKPEKKSKKSVMFRSCWLMKINDLSINYILYITHR